MPLITFLIIDIVCTLIIGLVVLREEYKNYSYFLIILMLIFSPIALSIIVFSWIIDKVKLIY